MSLFESPSCVINYFSANSWIFERLLPLSILTFCIFFWFKIHSPMIIFHSSSLHQWLKAQHTKLHNTKQLSFACIYLYIFLLKKKASKRAARKKKRIIFVIKIPFCSYSTKNILEKLFFFPSPFFILLFFCCFTLLL